MDGITRLPYYAMVSLHRCSDSKSLDLSITLIELLMLFALNGFSWFHKYLPLGTKCLNLEIITRDSLIFEEINHMFLPSES